LCQFGFNLLLFFCGFWNLPVTDLDVQLSQQKAGGNGTPENYSQGLPSNCLNSIIFNRSQNHGIEQAVLRPFSGPRQTAVIGFGWTIFPGHCIERRCC